MQIIYTKPHPRRNAKKYYTKDKKGPGAPDSSQPAKGPGRKKPSKTAKGKAKTRKAKD